MTRVLFALAFVLTVVALPTSSSRPACGAELAWSYADLVGRMLDLEYPATMPPAGEKCSQWASWDRSSRYDAETGKDRVILEP